MRKIKERISRWCKWCRLSKRNYIHKLLVLLGLRQDISFEITFTKKELKEIFDRAEQFTEFYPEGDFE